MQNSETVVSTEFGQHPSDQKWRPTLLTEPTVLYRSVSVPELRHIWESGQIIGGQNLCNPRDDRPWVFFGDEITSQLIKHGEDIERSAVFRVRHSHAPRKQKLEDERIAIEDAKVQWAAAENEKLRQAGKKIRKERTYLSPGLVRDPAWHLIQCREEALRRDYQALIVAFRGSVRREMVAIKNEQKAAGFTSAILETRPLTGARVYAANKEYGFLPGSVTTSDLTNVHVVRDGVIVETVPASRLDELMATRTTLQSEQRPCIEAPSLAFG